MHNMLAPSLCCFYNIKIALRSPSRSTLNLLSFYISYVKRYVAISHVCGLLTLWSLLWAGNVHIALRERVDGHGLTPVEQVRGKLQDLAERDVCIQ